MPIIPDPEIQEAAHAAFLATMGSEALTSFRQLVEMYRPSMATMQADLWLGLSKNDHEIFLATAWKLHGEIQAEAQPT
jgi:hypothetical protein